MSNTNKYAAWRTARTPDAKWKPTNLKELMACIGLKMIMGTNKKAQRRDYWSTCNFIGQEGFRFTIPVNRFEKIEKYLHISDREAEPDRNDPGYDRLVKLKPVIETLSRTFKKCYKISQYVSIDESMIAFSGLLSFKQYIPSKPIKRGVKLWARCCGLTGYMDQFEFYLGKKEGGYAFGLGYDVVMRLTADLVHTFRRVFVDNFFSSVRLALDLLKKGLYMCATTRSNRKGFPSDLKNVRLNRGDSAIRQYGHLCATVWKDRKNVCLLSTCSQPTEFDKVTRKTHAGRIEITRPDVIRDYNERMGGVDRHDQIRATYNLGFHNKKWWLKVFNALINIAAVNAYILFRETSTRDNGKKRYRHLDFRRELALQLIDGYSYLAEKPTATSVNDLLPEPAEHKFEEFDTRVKCHCHYHETGVRKDTPTGCYKCGLHLCDDCYPRVHENDELRKALLKRWPRRKIRQRKRKRKRPS